MEGRDDVRQARKEAIASITRCINLLESKILGSIDRANSSAESAIANPTSTATTLNDVQQEGGETELPPPLPPPLPPVPEQAASIDQEPTDTPQFQPPSPQPVSNVTHVSTMVINIPSFNGDSTDDANKVGE